MGRVELVFDRDKLQFSTAVLLVPVARGELVNAEFLVDTGSNTSGLSDETARRIGINPETLRTEATAGVGGITQEPIYSGTVEAYLTANLDKTLLKNPRVFFPITRKARKKVVGKVVAQKIQEFPIPNLLGMDAFSSINGRCGRLHLDLDAGTGCIEW
jgi:hypothetical protein